MTASRWCVTFGRHTKSPLCSTLPTACDEGPRCFGGEAGSIVRILNVECCRTLRRIVWLKHNLGHVDRDTSPKVILNPRRYTWSTIIPLITGGIVECQVCSGSVMGCRRCPTVALVSTSYRSPEFNLIKSDLNGGPGSARSEIDPPVTMIGHVYAFLTTGLIVSRDYADSPLMATMTLSPDRLLAPAGTVRRCQTALAAGWVVKTMVFPVAQVPPQPAPSRVK